VLPAVASFEAICEISGTHTKYGAAVPGANNTFSCNVN
jgi:hypothetical protein